MFINSGNNNSRNNLAFNSRERGFSLIASVSIMVLLAVIIMAMLALSTTYVRDARQERYSIEAQSNARMALMLAIGKLQKLAGPDTRVSARADINPEAYPGKLYWTGIWNTDGWDPRNASSRKFEGWLVSSPEQIVAEENVIQPFLDNDLVTLVDGRADANDEVQVRKVGVMENGKLSGRYAYWVGDEGVKASYKIPAMGEDDWNLAGILGVAPKSGMTSLELGDYDQLTEKELFSSGLTRQSIGLPPQMPQVSRELFHDITPQAISLLTDTRMGGVRRDLSTAFEIPRDEFDDIEEFHAAGEQNRTNFYDVLGMMYNDSRFYHEDQSPELGYVCEIPYEGKYSSDPSFNREGIVRGPSWDLLRNFSRFYKKEWEHDSWERSIDGVANDSFAARGSLPFSYSGSRVGPNANAGLAKGFGYHISSGCLYDKGTGRRWGSLRPVNAPRKMIKDGSTKQLRTVSRSPQLSPVVIRMSVSIGIVKHGIQDSDSGEIGFSFDPYLTIMNPYNVPITFDSVGIWCTKFNAFRVTIVYTPEGESHERTYNQEYFFSRNLYSRGSFTMRMDPEEGPYELAPGEIRVISPSKMSGSERKSKWNGISTIKGGFDYSEDSGFHMICDKGSKVIPEPGTTVKVRLRGRVPNNRIWHAAEKFICSLYHKKNHDGSDRDIFTHLPPPSIHTDIDMFDQPLITNLGFNTQDDKTQPNFYVERQLNESQIPNFDEGFEGESAQAYIGVLDVSMKTTSEDFPSLTVNPRGGSFDTRDYEGYDRSSPQWNVDFKLLGDISELELVSDFEGHAYWGEDRTAQDGQIYTPIYEVPQLPLTSLAQLQHMNTGVTGSSGSLQIGNSFPHPGIEEYTKIVDQRETVAGGYSAVKSQVLTDMSWASNEGLWDRYFFSGINWGDARSSKLGVEQPYENHQDAINALLMQDRGGSWPLQNPRIGLYTGDLTEEQKEDLYEYDKLAKYLAVFGGFNINSTSSKAWRAIFSSLREIDVTYVDSLGDKKSVKASHVFSRFMIPNNKAGETFGSFRDIDAEEIDLLADKMVEQVKARGPFMGLSDFVNRRLSTESGSDTDLGALGALQAAIEAAGLNDGKWSQKPDAPNIENVSYMVDGKSRDISTYAGTSGYLLQADILNSLGGIISARSDTFVIRAYGESLDANGKVVARAWCEATVQRTPQWIQATDEEVTIQNENYPGWSDEGILIKQWQKNQDFPKINQIMGRKFTIKSFRWLNSKEI